MNNMLSLLEKNNKYNNLSTIDLLNLYNLTESKKNNYHNKWDSDDDWTEKSSWHDSGEFDCEAKWKELYPLENSFNEEQLNVLFMNNDDGYLIKDKSIEELSELLKESKMKLQNCEKNLESLQKEDIKENEINLDSIKIIKHDEIQELNEYEIEIYENKEKFDKCMEELSLKNKKKQKKIGLTDDFIIIDYI